MIHSIKTVNADFFKMFTRNPITITVKGSSVPVAVVFSDRFNETPAEIQHQKYPIISIQDYVPKPSNKWKDSQHEYVDDFDFEEGVASLFHEPMLLNFRYDVSVATKTKAQEDELTDFMFKNFGVEGELLVGTVDLSGGEVYGYPVWYKVNGTDLPRTDGIKETNYEFTFECFIDIRDPKELELINRLNIKMSNG